MRKDDYGKVNEKNSMWKVYCGDIVGERTLHKSSCRRVSHRLRKDGFPVEINENLSKC